MKMMVRARDNNKNDAETLLSEGQGRREEPSRESESAMGTRYLVAVDAYNPITVEDKRLIRLGASASSSAQTTETQGA